MFGDDVLVDTNGKAIIAANYTDDNTPPSLLNYTLDLNSGEVILTFSEVVNISTLQVGLFQLQDSQNSSIVEESLVLSENTTYEAVSLTEIVMSLTQDDLNSLKELTGLVSGTSNT